MKQKIYIVLELFNFKLKSTTHGLFIIQVAPLVKERMMKEGTAMVTYNPLGNLVNFFRVVVPNLDISTSDMDFLIDEIVRLGEDIVISN